MCGIAGKFNFATGEPVSQELIRSMCDKMRYRGPDDSGVYAEGPVGLGHRRLSILDLSELGHQPMASEDGAIWITYNGEIYNFQLLRDDLNKKGYHFKSDCDTEVLIYLYREYGESCLDYLRGMFAFGIWDVQQSKLFLARDRIGKKPLFYYLNGQTLVFASEIKAILEDPIVKKEINAEALCDYFKYLYVPDPKTIYKNIYKLEPGHSLTITKEKRIDKTYWDVSFRSEIQGEEEICHRLIETLSESTQIRMISDVPLGAFLSGGIDSSAVVAMMAAASAQPVTTCAIGFDSKEYDEIAYARLISDKFKTDHHEFTVNQNAEDILKDLAYFFDEPFADASAVPTYYVSKLAREKVTVALSGDGGDENFAGYEKYYIDDIENRFRNVIPKPLRQGLFPGLAQLMSPWNLRFLQKATTLLTTLGHEADYGYYLTNSEFEERLWGKTINDDLKAQIKDYDPSLATLAVYNKADTDDHLSKILYTDLKTYLPGDILVKVDRMSMAHSLEVRAPILDHHMIELAAAIPFHLKYNRGNKKYILKKALKDILPAEVMHRKKMGFSVPLAAWLRGELKEFAYAHLINGKGIPNFFNMDQIHLFWEAHQSGKRNFGTILWAFLMFELWYQTFMD